MSQTIRQILHDEIEKVVEKLYKKKVDFDIDFNGIHAHYSANIALIIGGNVRENAEKIRKELLYSRNFNDFFSKLEIAGAGFLNFWLSEKGFKVGLENLDRKFPKQKEKISLDYLDANPTGPIHLGHARSGFYGDVLSNIFEFYGYKVSREFYVNNAKLSGQIQSLGQTASDLGEEYRHDQLKKILEDPSNKIKIKEKNDNYREIGFYIAGKIQKENEEFLKNVVKIKFDLFFEEENIYSSGKIDEIIGKLDKANAIYKKDGAIWLKSSEYGDVEDRVLIRSTGDPTYLLPDIGYHLDRLVKRKFNKAINIFGADHFGYEARLKAALSFLGVNPERIKTIYVQMVRLIRGGKEEKMSKREGIFITLEELIKEVGLDVVRFFFLMRSLDTHLDFDLDLAKEQSKKNPVYYVQYAYARASSILRKTNPLKRKLYFFSIWLAVRSLIGLLSRNKIKVREEKSSFQENLELKLIQFPEIIEDIAKNYQIHRLTTYTFELAKVFTNFYENVRVLEAETEELKEQRLILVLKTKRVLENCLKLMGISAPEKM